MKTLDNILGCKDLAQLLKELEDSVAFLHTQRRLPPAWTPAEEKRLVAMIDKIDDSRLWRALWSYLLVSRGDARIGEYCRSRLARFANIRKVNQEPGVQRPDVFLRYLFKHFPEERDALLAKFVHAQDITLRFAVAEELAKTDPDGALQQMRVLHEEAGSTVYHDIFDATDLWLAEAGT
ncbi:MAG: hypothetical protein HYX68_22620 [Planctomycetes bacterium]|jgi:hypothetical protein|nr:hypothetical protein [Planctomycetota bacterium]